MSDRQADADARQPLSNGNEPSIHTQHIERTIESLKAELAAGTPVEAERIADLEQRLIGLRLLQKFS